MIIYLQFDDDNAVNKMTLEVPQFMHCCMWELYTAYVTKLITPCTLGGEWYAIREHVVQDIQATYP